MWEAPHELLQLAKYTARTMRWSPSSRLAPTVHFKPIAAGSVLVNDRNSATIRQVRRHYEDAAAIEMESAGVAQAGHLALRRGVLAIRAISDRANQRHLESIEAQWVAAEHAAEFALALIRVLVTVGTHSTN